MLPVSGSPWFIVTYQKSNSFLGRAVAFLMFMFLVGLPDTDKSNNYADNCYHNTGDAYNCFQHHILYLSLYFPYVYLPFMEVLKMYSFWRKVNRLPFRIAPYRYYRQDRTDSQHRNNKILLIKFL